MCMCLKAHGAQDCDEDTVNRVMGAKPMQGATWEQALACAQHYGMRATLMSPCTVKQLKAWTDEGIPVMIAWNPEGREWSHASVVFDVDGDYNVSVADPNIPDPDETVRVVSKDDFYKKWYEKWPDYLVRRPAMAIEREITKDGRQVKASQNASLFIPMVVHETARRKLQQKPPASQWKPEHHPRPSGQLVVKHREEEKPKSWWERVKEKFQGSDKDASAIRVAEAADCIRDYKGGGLTWEEYQDCLRYWEREEGGGGYGGRYRRRYQQYPQAEPVAATVKQSREDQIEIDKALLALTIKKDVPSKEASFLYSINVKDAITEKQKSWRDAILRANAGLIREMPRNLRNFSYRRNGEVIGFGKADDPDHVAFVERYFEKWSRSSPSGEFDRLRPRSTPLPATPSTPEAPAAPAGKTVVESPVEDKIRILDTLARRLHSSPDVAVVEKVKAIYSGGGKQDPDDLKKIRNLLYRSSMRPDADHFRMASLEDIWFGGSHG